MMKNGNFEKEKPSIPNRIWSVGGITEHLGGVRATYHLLNSLPISPATTVVDLGCGTGFTACLLAQRQLQRVLALDRNSSSMNSAQKRIQKMGYSNTIELIQADIQKIPIQDNQADVVIAESVLVFTQLNTALSEIRRVLKNDGFLADNEMILLKTPTPQLEDLLKNLMGIHTFSEEGWKNHFVQAGFNVVNSSIYHLKLSDQLSSHIQVDGLAKYLKAVVVGLSDKTLWHTFINREILQAFLDFRSYIGYELFVLNKQ
jgi:SAM-dependent methyltransferase